MPPPSQLTCARPSTPTELTLKWLIYSLSPWRVQTHGRVEKPVTMTGVYPKVLKDKGRPTDFSWDTSLYKQSTHGRQLNGDVGTGNRGKVHDTAGEFGDISCRSARRWSSSKIWNPFIDMLIFKQAASTRIRFRQRSEQNRFWKSCMSQLKIPRQCFKKWKWYLWSLVKDSGFWQ